MNVLLDNLDQFRDGFVGTVSLTAVSAVLALVLGTVIAGFRVSPVPPLRIFGTVWVALLRNTPLTLLFMATVFVLPQILFPGTSSYLLAVLALGVYTSSFVCEAVRSGINTVPIGQAEAARSIGMTFAQTIRVVVLPQATRTVLPPLSSIMIALTKNSAIAGAFNNFDLFAAQKVLTEKGYSAVVIFFWVALAYLILVFLISGLFRLLERQLGVAR